MKRTEKKPANQIGPQGKAFIKTALEIGCDEDEAAFEKRLSKLTKAKIKVEKSTGSKKGK